MVKQCANVMIQYIFFKPVYRVAYQKKLGGGGGRCAY